MKRSSLCLLVICLSLLSAGPFAVAKAPRPAKGDVQIEISLTGIIQKTGMSTCMDGAKYQVVHIVSDANGKKHSAVTRIITTNPEAEAFLKKVAGTKMRVTVTGYPHQGVECPYLAVYYAGPAH